jgi:hypothetical protein
MWSSSSYKLLYCARSYFKGRGKNYYSSWNAVCCHCQWATTCVWHVMVNGNISKISSTWTTDTDKSLVFRILILHLFIVLEYSLLVRGHWAYVVPVSHLFLHFLWRGPCRCKCGLVYSELYNIGNQFLQMTNWWWHAACFLWKLLYCRYFCIRNVEAFTGVDRRI